MALISVHKMWVLAPLNVETWLLLLPLSNGTLPTTTKKDSWNQAVKGTLYFKGL